MPRVREKNVVAAQWSSERLHRHRRPDRSAAPTIFGANVFGPDEQRQRLPKEVFRQLQATIDRGEPLDADLADAVALADEGLGAREGRDPLHPLVPAPHRVDRREARLLLRARSATAPRSPSSRARSSSRASRTRPASRRGGIRATFEARGYTAWDPTSPAFIIENPNGAFLCIPTAFASWTGEALDTKIPLLRSMEALNKSALRALRLFGDSDDGPRLHHDRARAGVLPDRRELLLRAARPGQHGPHALRRQAAQGPRAGRPLLRLDPGAGARLHARGRVRAGQARRPDQDPPQRGGAGPVRGRADLRELERRHRPPAALHAGDADRRAALRPGLPAPREALRGRQRLGQAQQLVDGHRRRREPPRARATRPHDNLQFLFFATAVIAAVHKHQELLRASIAGAGQDHRLGANEAPPAIISIFLGTELEDVFDGDRRRARRRRARPAR